MPRIANPDGAAGSKIAIVAARPGKHEVGLCDCADNAHPRGIGLVGPSGNLLWRLLQRKGISRRDVYVTNVRKDYDPDHSVPTVQECNEARSQLLAELSQIQPNIVIALGNEALFTLTGEKRSVEKWRGSIISDLSGRKLISSWHPAACLRTPQWTYVLDADLRRAVEQSRFPDIRLRRRELIVGPNIGTFVEVIRSFTSPVSVDIETFGKSISCIGISDSPDRALCLDLIGPSNLSMSDKVLAVREMNYVLANSELIGQNVGMFDCPRLRAFGFRLGPILMDTMLSHHLLWPELGMKSKEADTGKEKFAGSHDLAFLISVYTDIPFYKDMADRWKESDPPDWDMYRQYNCLDAVGTYEVAVGDEYERRPIRRAD